MRQREDKMRKTILYIGMSLDGYIADDQGGVGWMRGDGSDPGNPGSYPEFLASVDTIVMGYHTYRQIIDELSPDRWVYPGKRCYVLTHRPLNDIGSTTFVQGDVGRLLDELRRQDGSNIWICGGADIVHQLLSQDQIDMFCISVIPVILGTGVPLFAPGRRRQLLRLLSTRCYNGITDLWYEKRQPMPEDE